jgi:hypothetical protein
MRIFVWLIAIFAGAVACIEQGSGEAQTSPRPLFTVANLEQTTLTPKQDKILRRIQGRLSKGAENEFVVVHFEKSSLETASPEFLVPLPENDQLEIRNVKVTTDKGAKHLNWTSKTNSDSVSVSITDNSAAGLIYVGNRVYSIEPLGNGLQVITRTHQHRFPPDEPPEAQQRIEKVKK